MLRSALLAGAAFALLPNAAFAQAQDATPARAADDGAGGTTAPADAATADAPPAQGDDRRAAESQDIVVTGSRIRGPDLLAGTTAITGEQLTRDIRPSIGETLQHLPGVSATSFGPNASRPVLRGFQGERVSILTDGIGSLDVSSTSADHAVAINPLTADRIDVLRGPTALLYGTSAIGGVVNVLDSRIPRRVPADHVHIDGILTYGSAANERSGNAAADLPVGGNFVVHVDGNYSQTDDMEIGGYALAPALRAQALASADPAIRALADIRGTLPNSAAKTWDIAAGAAWISGQNNVGFSINHYDSLYGVPIRYSLDPAIDAEAPRLDIAQTRIDGRAEIDTGSGFLDTIQLRGGYSDYRHFELEESGAIATRFDSTGYEGRAEFVQSTRGGWGGGFGANMSTATSPWPARRNSCPTIAPTSSACSRWRRSTAGASRPRRPSATSTPPMTLTPIRSSATRRSAAISTRSARLGAQYTIAPGWRIGLNASRTERAPSVEELFANGPHGGTQSFEIGNPNIDLEKSWGLEATIRGAGQGYTLGASVFHSWFNGYIYETPTGAIRDDLPVFQYFQANARYYGFELEGSVKVARIGNFDINLDGVGDYVHATITGSGPAPRIPPLRLLGGIEAQSDRINGRVEVEWVADQTRIAAFETPTDGYTMVNASLSFRPFHDNSSSILLSANNIFDVDARRHASFLKDYAPLSGRDLRISARFTF